MEFTMSDRLDLQTLLEAITEDVYFQPPETVKITYPCIIYERSDIRTDYADNNPYSLKKEYTITVIDKNPDSLIPDMIALLPTASFDRHFTADNLNHDVFTLFF
jgi:hypothetical protein